MARPVDARKHELWRQRFARFRRSELSVAEFCRSEQISQASFYQWRRKLADDKPRPNGTSVKHTDVPTAEHFVPMEVASAPARLQFSFPNGAQLLIDAQDPLLLQAVVQAVAAVNITGSEE